MTADHHCFNCLHLFHTCHVEDTRDVATQRELDTGRCDDCKACHPPEIAPIRERDLQEATPA